MIRLSVALLLASTAFTALPALAATRVKVQAGDHADFSRLALVSPQGAPEVDVESCGGRITLPNRAAWPLETLGAAYSRRLTDFRVADGGRSLTLQWPCGARVAVRQEKKVTFLDVAEPPVPARKPGAPAVEPEVVDVPVAEAPPSSPPLPSPPLPATPVAAPPPSPADPAIRAFDLDAWAGDDFPERKRALEQAIAETQGRARVDALIAMARFTLARAMPEEGRAALDAADSQRPATDQRYELRLLRDAFRALDGTADPDDSVFVRTPPGPAADHHVWRAATLAPTRWAEAKPGLPIVLKRLLSYPADLRGRLLTLLADAAGESDPASLNLIVMAMITLDGVGAGDGRLDYFRGRLAELQDSAADALRHYGNAASAPGLYGHRAQVRAIELRLAGGALAGGVMDDARAIAELETLRYAWRGDDVETDALAVLGAAYARVGRTDAALDIFGLLGRRFGATARGRAALTTGRTLLTAVVDRLEESSGGALDALALQVRHGRVVALMDDEAGTQRRRLARRLARDGFTLEAAKLLHGLAEDARGPRRVEIGLELARVLLDSGRGGEALAVLDHTGGGSADPALAERRALLRAESFAVEGEAMRAFDALRGLSGPAAVRIRARSLFQAGEWAASRAAYAEMLDKVDAPDPDDVAQYALAAFRAGDAEAVGAAAAKHGKRLAGTRWAGLLDALAAPVEPRGKPLSTAAVSGQLASAGALADVVRRWRAAP
ncbi:hypothetical protein [Azospirillum rugosum]|uniref:Tetratricopeptide (TPR) repeat protein n=1 Tax=Azospirillum rugosum TaxID=416170 RepID=A0ABS4STY2_9PROT|nr:hypothetical protein [Azospirillum rugosum]MBP2296021.1 tetratricopeptide (TPR) repeat protein [Azospirillum rugosum]MDQ0529611.1 tetratricopeptide (TPR) repeat protein [Azospirillum rugosum]